MKLLNDFFEIVEISGEGSTFSATVKVFPDHIIYKGHFPGYPITPGVILIQIVHELIESRLEQTIRLREMLNCKFLKVINPEKENLLTFVIDHHLKDGALHVKAVGKSNSEVFLKLSAVYENE